MGSQMENFAFRQRCYTALRLPALRHNLNRTVPTVSAPRVPRGFREPKKWLKLPASEQEAIATTIVATFSGLCQGHPGEILEANASRQQLQAAAMPFLAASPDDATFSAE